MALQRVRHYSLFAQGKKVAECFRNKASFKSGDEPQFGDDGMLGMSDGAGTLELTFDAIAPVAGMSVQFEQFVLGKIDLDMQMGLINGKIWQSTMRCTQAEYDGDAKAGTLNGSFTLMGQPPQIT